MTTIPSSAALIAAAADTDLTARLIARGAALGLSQGSIELAIRRLARSGGRSGRCLRLLR